MKAEEFIESKIREMDTGHIPQKGATVFRVISKEDALKALEIAREEEVIKARKKFEQIAKATGETVRKGTKIVQARVQKETAGKYDSFLNRFWKEWDHAAEWRNCMCIEKMHIDFDRIKAECFLAGKNKEAK